MERAEKITKKFRNQNELVTHVALTVPGPAPPCGSCGAVADGAVCCPSMGSVDQRTLPGSAICLSDALQQKNINSMDLRELWSERWSN